jgi:hypothetical protein
LPAGFWDDDEVTETIMAKRAFPFDPLVAERLLSYIQSGGYPQVAAEAAGVPEKVFLQWIEWGEKNRAREPYRGFARSVRQAMAHGRLVAELAVHEKDPKFWLTHGPGKEAAGNPGWTGEVKPANAQSSGNAYNADLQWQALYTVLMRALAEFPEARLAVAQALRGLPAGESSIFNS